MFKPDGIYTAWELAGSWEWTTDCFAVPEKGRTLFVEAVPSASQQSVAMRGFKGLKPISRYYDPDARFRLVLISQEKQRQTFSDAIDSVLLTGDSSGSGATNIQGAL